MKCVRKCTNLELSTFRNTCPYHPYHPNLFCCNTEIMSSNPSSSLNSLFETLSFILTPHIHLTILISALRTDTSISFLTGQVSLPCNILLSTQHQYSLPLLIDGVSLLVSSGTKCLKWFGAVRGQPRSSTMSPFNRVHMISYLSLIETMHLSCTVFEIRRVICRNSPTSTYPTCMWRPRWGDPV